MVQASSNIEKKVQEIILNNITLLDTKHKITYKSSLKDDLGADSLDTIEIMMALEDEFDIKIPDEDAEKIITIKDAVEYVEKKMEWRKNERV